MSTPTDTRPGALSTRPDDDDRRPGELTVRELLRWTWRQLTSMRTALIVLLLTGWWDQAVSWLQIHLVTSTETAV